MKSIITEPITATEYYRLAEEGFFEDGERVELLEGEIVPMVPIGFNHATAVNLAMRAFRALTMSDQIILSSQNPIALDNLSIPQPDLTLLAYREDGYRGRKFTPEDALLVIEVADTTLREDRERKIPLYGTRGIRESWLIDLNSNVIHIFRKPSAKGYLKSSVAKRGEKIAPEAFPDFEILVDDLLP
jgi:Uma2 family endonuclease